MVRRTRVLAVVALFTVIAGVGPAPAVAQVFQGPAQGTSAPGMQALTTAFPAAPAQVQRSYERPPPHTVPLLPDPASMMRPLAPVGFNEQDDPAGLLPPVPGTMAPTVITDFPGITMTSSVPPDPIIAAGPNHLMPLVNRDFAIFDKTGNNLKQIHAPDWFAAVAPGNNAFDPKVVYDHFDDRWVMVWLAVNTSNQTSNILVSVSDDSDPNGTWCNWALPGNQNGSTVVSNWSDYQGLGFDENAVYVVPNQFSFSGGFDYAKIRILPKTTLYDGTCPAITFTDFWDLRDPANTGGQNAKVFTVRPAVTFGTPGTEYLINDSPFVSGTFMTLWEITDPLSASPGLTGTNVATTARDIPPDADQLGGSTVLIDVGGPRVRNLVFRNGSVWTAHSVADATGQFARARYVRIDVTGPSVLEDVSFGVDGCWLYYPAVTADLNNNMTMVYTRSCTDEYASVRYTGRTAADPGLQPSAELKAGEANYEIAVGNPPRNRWGDYSGVAVDPAAPDRIWVFGEYAETPVSGSDQWGTWIGQTALRALGDVNNDGTVDVGDLVLLVDFILEIQTPTPDEEFFADCTRDTGLDIGDVVCLVDTILQTTPAAPLAAAIVPSSAASGPLQARLSVTTGATAAAGRTVLLELDDAGGIAAAHARIAYDPARLRIGEPQLGVGADGFSLASHDDGNGELGLVLYSLERKELQPGAGPLVRIPVTPLGGEAAGEPELEVRDLFLADRSGRVTSVMSTRATLTALPGKFRLGEIIPNPIRPASPARLELDIPETVAPALSGSAGARGPGGSVRVRVDVYNVRGQRIRTVMDSDLLPGQHTIEWDGRNARGGLVGSGLYVIRVSAGREFTATRKLIVSSR